jgi:tetratricopeptide (TPR) repeat protein
MADLKALEQRALELIKQSDFGPEAVQVNAAILEQAPTDERAWTRLGRCHLEQRQFDEAVSALRSALSINPSNGIATNLLNEVRKRRALTPSATERIVTGFSTREFALLETLGTEDACRQLRPRIEALFDTINGGAVAARIVAARQREGAASSKLFHANSFHADGPGHIFAFHHGGRWEPQFNLGWFAESAVPCCVRAGIGFNVSAAGRDQDRGSGPEQALRYFERFQQTIEKSWKRELARWMSCSRGFIQYGKNPPALDMQPERAVEWLLTCRNAAAHEWIFVGRWFFLDRPDDAKALADRGKLAAAMEDTFRALFPLWLTTYSGAAPAE